MRTLTAHGLVRIGALELYGGGDVSFLIFCTKRKNPQLSHCASEVNSVIT
jgi:hypothetical protein